MRREEKRRIGKVAVIIKFNKINFKKNEYLGVYMATEIVFKHLFLMNE